MNKPLTKAQKSAVEWSLNFYLYEEDLEHSKSWVNLLERAKKNLGMRAGNGNEIDA